MLQRQPKKQQNLPKITKGGHLLTQRKYVNLQLMALLSCSAY